MGIYCPQCGARTLGDTYPKKCPACGNIEYRNPIPVAVGLVPVIYPPRLIKDRPHWETAPRWGLLVVRRGIPPQVGRLALPGGYMELGETWEQAVAREVREETGREINPTSFRPYGIRTVPRGLLLIFGLCEPIELGPWFTEFRANEEVQALDVIHEPTDLAFPTHTEAANDWFTGVVR